MCPSHIAFIIDYERVVVTLLLYCYTKSTSTYCDTVYYILYEGVPYFLPSPPPMHDSDHAEYTLITVVKVDQETRRYYRLLKNKGARLLNTGLKKSQTHSYPAHIGLL